MFVCCDHICLIYRNYNYYEFIVRAIHFPFFCCYNYVFKRLKYRYSWLYIMWCHCPDLIVSIFTDGKPGRKAVAKLEYEWIKSDLVDLYHTLVPTQYRGQGIAKVLAEVSSQWSKLTSVIMIFIFIIVIVVMLSPISSS